MVEQAAQGSRLPLGEDLPVGHVHARPPNDTAVSDLSPGVKRRLRRKTSLAEIERQERGRSRIPQPPSLRLLNRDPAEVPISEGLLVPGGSPISGQEGAHPCTPVGNAVGSLSFEYVASTVNRATSEIRQNESVETIPIARSSSSPSIVHNPIQVMSPNLVAGSACIAQPILAEWRKMLGSERSFSNGKT